MNPDLNLVTTTDLVAELLSRADHGIIGLLKETDDDTQSFLLDWVGHQHVCAGLATDLTAKVLESRRNQSRDSDDF